MSVMSYNGAAIIGMNLCFFLSFLRVYNRRKLLSKSVSDLVIFLNNARMFTHRDTSLKRSYSYYSSYI